MNYRSDKLMIDGHTDTQTHRHTQATTIPEGQNWPRVKIDWTISGSGNGSTKCLQSDAQFAQLQCVKMNETRLHWWYNIGPGNSLVPSGKEPLPELMMTKLFDARYNDHKKNRTKSQNYDKIKSNWNNNKFIKKCYEGRILFLSLLFNFLPMIK